MRQPNIEPPPELKRLSREELQAIWKEQAKNLLARDGNGPEAAHTPSHSVNIVDNPKLQKALEKAFYRYMEQIYQEALHLHRIYHHQASGDENTPKRHKMRNVTMTYTYSALSEKNYRVKQKEVAPEYAKLDYAELSKDQAVALSGSVLNIACKAGMAHYLTGVCDSTKHLFNIEARLTKNFPEKFSERVRQYLNPGYNPNR